MLSSLQNPLVKRCRKLQVAKERRKQGMFLLEGTHLIEEALAAEWPLAVVCCTENWINRYPSLWRQMEMAEVRCELVSDAVMGAIATTVHPDGVVAIAPRRSFGVFEHSLNSSEQKATPVPSRAAPSSASALRLGIALETLQDPGNLGTIIRSAAAGGVDGLWLSRDSVDPDNPKVLRASAGQWFRMPMSVSLNLPDDIAALHRQGVQVVATAADAPMTYWEADLTIPTIIVAGNEGAGLSDDLKAMADVTVRIPIVPGVESLNVAIAVSLLIFEANRQQAQ